MTTHHYLPNIHRFSPVFINPALAREERGSGAELHPEGRRRRQTQLETLHPDKNARKLAAAFPISCNWRLIYDLYRFRLKSGEKTLLIHAAAGTSRARVLVLNGSARGWRLWLLMLTLEERDVGGRKRELVRIFVVNRTPLWILNSYIEEIVILTKLSQCLHNWFLLKQAYSNLK